MARDPRLQKFMDQWKQEVDLHGRDHRSNPKFRDETFRFQSAGSDYFKASHRAESVLEEANFDKEYGVLEYSFAEALQFGRSVPTALQNYVGGVLADLFTSQARAGAIRAGKQPDGTLLTKDQYYTKYPQAVGMVLGQPLNFDNLTRQVVEGKQVGELYPELTQVRSARDAANFLVSTVDPGFIERSVALGKLGQDKADVLQHMRLNHLATMPEYRPKFVDSSGVERTLQYQDWASRKAFTATHDYMQQELIQTGLKGKSWESDVDNGGREPDISEIAGAPYSNPPIYQPHTQNDFAMQQLGLRGSWGKYGQFGSASLQISEINPESPLYKAGVRSGWVALGFNDVIEEGYGNAVADAADTLEGGGTINMLFAEPVGASADPNGVFSERFQQRLVKIQAGPYMPRPLREQTITDLAREEGGLGERDYRDEVSQSGEFDAWVSSLPQDYEPVGQGLHVTLHKGVSQRHQNVLARNDTPLRRLQADIRENRIQPASGQYNPSDSDNSVLGSDAELWEFAAGDQPRTDGYIGGVNAVDKDVLARSARASVHVPDQSPNWWERKVGSAAGTHRTGVVYGVNQQGQQVVKKLPLYGRQTPYPDQYDRSHVLSVNAVNYDPKNDPVLAKRRANDQIRLEQSPNEVDVESSSDMALSHLQQAAYASVDDLVSANDLSVRVGRELLEKKETRKNSRTVASDIETRMSIATFQATQRAKYSGKRPAPTTPQPGEALPPPQSEVESRGRAIAISRLSPEDRAAWFRSHPEDRPRGQARTGNVRSMDEFAGVDNSGSDLIPGSRRGAASRLERAIQFDPVRASGGSGNGNQPPEAPPLAFDNEPPMSTPRRSQTPRERFEQRPTEFHEGERMSYLDKRAKRETYAVYTESDQAAEGPGWYAIQTTNPMGEYRSTGDKIQDPGYGTLYSPEGKVLHKSTYDEYQLFTKGDEVKADVERGVPPSVGVPVGSRGAARSQRQFGSLRITNGMPEALRQEGHRGFNAFYMLAGSNPALRSAHSQPGGSPNDFNREIAHTWNFLGADTRLTRERAIEIIGGAFPELDEPSVEALAESVLEEKSRTPYWNGAPVNENYDPTISGTGGRGQPRYNRADLARQAKAQVTPERAAGYSSALRGSARMNRDGSYSIFKNGEEVLPSGHFLQAVGAGQQAVEEALSEPLPTHPEEAVATFEQRVSDGLNRKKKAVTQELEQSGISPELAKTVANFRDDIAKKAIYAAKRHVIGELEQDAVARGASIDAEMPDSIRFGSVQVRSPETARAMAADPQYAEIATKMAEMGKTPEELATNKQKTILTTSDGKSFAFGGDGYDGENRNGNMWGGKVGKALYGAYLFKRLWSMSAQPGVMASEKYMDGLGHEFETMAAIGSDYSEGGTAMASRRSVGAERGGKAAADIYGGFSDIGYMTSGIGNGLVGRAGHYLGLAGGIAGGGFMGAQIAASMNMISPTTAAAAGPAGLVLAGGVLGSAALMEGINQAAYQGRPVVTPGNLVQNALATGAYVSSTFRAKQEYLEQNPGAWAPLVFPATGENAWAHMNREEKAIVTAVSNRQSGADGDVEKSRQFISALAISAYETEEEASAAGRRLRQLFGDEFDTDSFGAIARKSGLGTKTLAQGAENYAKTMGFKTGSAAFDTAFNWYVGQDNRGRETGEYRAGRISALGSQMQATMPSDEMYENMGVDLVRKYDLSPDQMPLVQSLTSTAQQYMGRLSSPEYTAIARTASLAKPHMRGMVASLAGSAGAIGADSIAVGEIAARMDIDPSQMQLAGAILGGDSRAASFQSWQTGQDLGRRFFDRAGNPISETSGRGAVNVASFWSNVDNIEPLTTSSEHFDQVVGAFLGPGAALDGFPGLGTDEAKAGWMLGVEGTPNAMQSQMITAYLDNGRQGVQKLARQKSREARDASLGIAFAGIALTEQFYWGAQDGGTWDTPTTGSSWDIENRMRQLQHSSQLADFSDQGKRMDLSNRFSIRREGNQGQRMNVSNAYNLWSMDTSYAQGLQQRGWTREDWQFQDTTREAQFGWQMEDMDEAVRYSSGRDRRKAIRQQDRAALMHNLEGQQIDTQRERQETQWSQEDERYQKQRDYTLELQRLDKESFDQGVKQRETGYKMDREQLSRKMEEYEQQKKLQDELQILSREYQYEQLQLQKASLGAQAEVAKAQDLYNESLLVEGERMGKLSGVYEQLQKYDTTFQMLNALASMAEGMSKVNYYTIYNIGELMKEIGSLDPMRIRAIAAAMAEMGAP